MRQPLLLGLAGVGFTAEVDKNKQLDALTSFRLGDYSLEFEGGTTEIHGPRKSPGITKLQEGPLQSVCRTKIFTPLKDDFFKAGH